MIDIDSIITTTRQYLTIPSVVGHESFFMNYLYDDFKDLGLSVFKFDGVLEIYGNSRKSAMICAHIDRHGLISLGNDEYVYAAQYIREIKYGEINKSSQQQVEALAKRFEGEAMYAYHPDNAGIMGTGIIESCYPHMLKGDALFYTEGFPQLEKNIPIAYAQQVNLDDDLVKGQIDNVISLAVIYELFKNGYQGTALLTCEEEIGKSGQYIAKYLEGSKIETKSLLVLDTSPYIEQKTMNEGHVVLRTRDKTESFNGELLKKLKERCITLALPFQVKDELLIASGKTTDQLGTTELGRLVQETNGRWSGATVQIPTVMYHTSNETTSIPAIKNYYSLLHDILIEHPMKILKYK